MFHSHGLFCLLIHLYHLGAFLNDILCHLVYYRLFCFYRLIRVNCMHVGLSFVTLNLIG